MMQGWHPQKSSSSTWEHNTDSTADTGRQICRGWGYTRLEKRLSTGVKSTMTCSTQSPAPRKERAVSLQLITVVFPESFESKQKWWQGRGKRENWVGKVRNKSHLFLLGFILKVIHKNLTSSTLTISIILLTQLFWSRVLLQWPQTHNPPASNCWMACAAPPTQPFNPDPDHQSLNIDRRGPWCPHKGSVFTLQPAASRVPLFCLNGDGEGASTQSPSHIYSAQLSYGLPKVCSLRE